MNIYTATHDAEQFFVGGLMPAVVVNPEGYVGSRLDLGLARKLRGLYRNKMLPGRNADRYFTNRRFWQ